MDGFPSTFFALYEVIRGLFAQDVLEGPLDSRQRRVHGGAYVIGQVVDGLSEQLLVAIVGDLAVDLVQLRLVIVEISQRNAFLVEKEQDIQGFA